MDLKLTEYVKHHFPSFLAKKKQNKTKQNKKQKIIIIGIYIALYEEHSA